MRGHTKIPLSIVSSRYKPVQPAEILEFYRDLAEIGGYEVNGYLLPTWSGLLNVSLSRLNSSRR